MKSEQKCLKQKNGLICTWLWLNMTNQEPLGSENPDLVAETNIQLMLVHWLKEMNTFWLDDGMEMKHTHPMRRVGNPS